MKKTTIIFIALFCLGKVAFAQKFIDAEIQMNISGGYFGIQTFEVFDVTYIVNQCSRIPGYKFISVENAGNKSIGKSLAYDSESGAYVDALPSVIVPRSELGTILSEVFSKDDIVKAVSSDGYLEIQMHLDSSTGQVQEVRFYLFYDNGLCPLLENITHFQLYLLEKRILADLIYEVPVGNSHYTFLSDKVYVGFGDDGLIIADTVQEIKQKLR